MAPACEPPRPPPYILVFESQGGAEPSASAGRAQSGGSSSSTSSSSGAGAGPGTSREDREVSENWRATCCCCGAFWVSGSRLGRTLRVHLIIAILEAFGLTVVFLVTHGWLSLMLFTFFLILHALLIFGTIRECEIFSDVCELRRFRRDITARLWATAFGAWLPVFWWLFQLTFELQGRRCGTGCYLPVSGKRVSFACVMVGFHVAIMCHLFYLARSASRGLAQYLLQADKIWACKFKDIPEGRAHPSEDRCVICLGEYEEDDMVLLLPCRHLFHQCCISQWLQKADLCPMRCESALLELPYLESSFHSESKGVSSQPAASPVRTPVTSSASTSAAGEESGAEGSTERASTSASNQALSPSTIGARDVFNAGEEEILERV